MPSENQEQSSVRLQHVEGRVRQCSDKTLVRNEAFDGGLFVLKADRVKHQQLVAAKHCAWGGQTPPRKLKIIPWRTVSARVGPLLVSTVTRRSQSQLSQRIVVGTRAKLEAHLAQILASSGDKSLCTTVLRTTVSCQHA